MVIRPNLNSQSCRVVQQCVNPKSRMFSAFPLYALYIALLRNDQIESALFSLDVQLNQIYLIFGVAVPDTHSHPTTLKTQFNPPLF